LKLDSIAKKTTLRIKPVISDEQQISSMDNIDDVRALKQMLINAHDKPSTPLRGKSRGGGDWTPSSDKSLK